MHLYLRLPFAHCLMIDVPFYLSHDALLLLISYLSLWLGVPVPSSELVILLRGQTGMCCLPSRTALWLAPLTTTLCSTMPAQVDTNETKND